MRLQKICEPIKIGTMELKNRMVMPAMLVNSADKGGFVSDRTKTHYEERAKGGAGLIIVGAITINYQAARLIDKQLCLDDDKFLSGLSELVDIIHNNGAKVAAQLQHGGNVVTTDVINSQPVAPSAVARPGYETPRELTLDEISEVIDRFADCAGRAKRAGFDAIELNACHRYLIQNFLSSAWNNRRDEYGGDLRNRARFLLEIVRAIKERVGQDFPLQVRLNGKEFGVEGGTTIQEAKEVAIMVQEAGVNCVNISAFPAAYPYAITSVAPTLPLFHHGCFAHLAAGVKAGVHIPVIAVGRITPEHGEKLIRKGEADLIAFGRGLIADPELPNKVMSGRLDEIRRCLGCQECYGPIEPAVHCTVNAMAFKDKREYSIIPAPEPKKVLIAGAGPAGMEAARVAALRGHSVIVYEKGRTQGGEQLQLATLFREEYATLTAYLSGQLRKLGIRVNMGKKVTPAIVDEVKPDAIIIATGPKSYAQEIPGINGRNVVNTARLRKRKLLWTLASILLRNISGRSFIRWMMRFNLVFKEKVVVIGGGLAGGELADFLSEKGKNVSIVTEDKNLDVGLGTMPVLRDYYMGKLASEGTTILTGVKYKRITEKGIDIETVDGESRTIEARTIAYISNVKPDSELSTAIAGKVAEVYTIGDSSKPGGILEAIEDGFLAGTRV